MVKCKIRKIKHVEEKSFLKQLLNRKEVFTPAVKPKKKQIYILNQRTLWMTVEDFLLETV